MARPALQLIVLVLLPGSTAAAAAEDPGDMKNLAASPKRAQILDQHRAYLRQWLDHYGDAFAAKYAVR